MKTTKKKTRAKQARGPFAHAADYRDALAAFDVVLAELAGSATRWDRHTVMRASMGLSGSAAHMFHSSANRMIEGGHRLRAACRRL
jgi:hypothetical protein